MRKRLLVSALPIVPAIVLLTLGMLVAGVDACGSDSTNASAPPPLPTGSPVVRDAAIADSARHDSSTDGGTGAVDAADAGAQRHFTGTLAMTSTVPFGGAPYCKYTMTMKQVDVDVTLSGAGDVAAGSVTNLAVEATVQPCPNAAQPASIEKYSLASSLRLPSGGLHLELAPDPANVTVASLVLEGDFSGDHVAASVEWHRTDQQPPLDWRVTTSVPLDRR